VHVAAIDQGVAIEIDIASAEAFGQLRFLGGLTVDIGTRLQLVLLDGFTPGQELLLPLVHFDTRQTEFSGLQYLMTNTSVWQRDDSGDTPWLGGSWELAMNADGPDMEHGWLEVRLVTAPVPEPATWGLLGAGLAWLPTVLRRRRGRHPAHQ